MHFLMQRFLNGSFNTMARYRPRCPIADATSSSTGCVTVVSPSSSSDEEFDDDRNDIHIVEGELDMAG